MSGSAQGGNDILTLTATSSSSGFQPNNNLIGDASVMSGSAQGGDDTLTAINSGSNSRSSLSGDASSMSGSAQGGDDTLTATDSGIGSSATLFGDAEGMSESAHGGNDILNGGVGNDTLYGDARGYFLTSPGLITGGTDTLNGGAGDDQLWGGPNDDVFVFNVGSGNDVINDFNQGNSAVGSMATEHDVIDVQAYNFADWNTLQAAISDVSGNAVIQLSDNDSITLVGVQKADLLQTDFII
jgi:Ca2+-binding RTX toxin-like protein